MHDLVHNFAQVVSKGECINMKNKDMENVACASSNRSVVRNLRIGYESRSPIKGSLFSSMEDLRCFITLRVDDIEPYIWGHLRGIRSLVLTDSRLIKIPSAINQLIHMRHLEISENEKLEELPEEICELYNLWTLIINMCSKLKRLPRRMDNKLVNLKHLEIAQPRLFLPKSIGRLTRLKTLTEFRIQEDQRQGGVTIADLKDMNQLQRTLRVYDLSNVAESYEVEQAHFARKTALTGLHLYFGNGYESGYDRDNVRTNYKDAECLEAVRPSTNLEELGIRYYMGATSVSPSWMMSLANLTRLTISCCENVEYLPPLGGLPSLAKLAFAEMRKVKKVGVELMGMTINDIGAFPRLTMLRFEEMRYWEEWDGTMLSSPSVMPQLSSLIISYCGKLKKLPDAILQKPSLKRLEVRRCVGLETYMCEEENDKVKESPEMVVSQVWDKMPRIPTIIVNDIVVRAASTADTYRSASWGW